MDSMTVFFGSVLLALVLAAAVVFVLRKSLRSILIDLCGNERRGVFWSIYSSVFLGLATLVAAMLFPPTLGSNPSTSEVFQSALVTFRAGAIGLLIALAAVGLMIASFVTLQPSREAKIEGPPHSTQAITRAPTHTQGTE